MPEQRALLRKSEVEQRLNVSKRTVDRLIAAGQLEAVRLTTRTTRIYADSVDAYLRRVAA